MLKTHQWYMATDQFGDDEDNFWYNYFFEIGDRVKYISVESNFSSIYYINESSDEFEENVESSYEFDEISLTISKIKKIFIKLSSVIDIKEKREIIKGFFK